MKPKNPAVVTPAADCVFAELLARWAQERPDHPFARFPDGDAWTYARTYELACRTAHRLRALGVRQGDNVLCWLPNGPDMLRLWLALNLLGAVFVPFNVSYRGSTLHNVLKLSRARLLIGHATLVERLADVPLEQLADVVVLGEAADAADDMAVPGVRMHAAAALEGSDASPIAPDTPVRASDTQSIIFTSGTTGPSKAVLSSYAHLYAQGAEAFDFFTADDCFMVNLPMFHCGGTIPVGVALARGGAISVLDQFRADDFWDIVRRTGTTVAYVIVRLPQLLLKRAPHPDDTTHPLRTVIISGDIGAEFRARFGCDYVTIFNMSEICTPIRSALNTDNPKSCGVLRDGIEARLVDPYDSEVDTGAVGELILRTHRPWMLSHGYAGNPEATAQAWRNGWFHTGDLLRQDAAGHFYFVDRVKDAIRRKGENISSVEVEQAVCSHPAVLEAAALPVRDDSGDEEVLVTFTHRPDMPVDAAALTDYLIRKLPYFMVPRYLHIAQALPKTSTGKIQKTSLRSQELVVESWDREKAGIILKKERLN